MSTTNCELLVGQAISEIQKGDFQKARMLLQYAYEHSCGMFGGVHVGFGAIYEHNKEIEKALAAFDYAVKVESLPPAYNNRGRMYYLIGDLQNALIDYQMTIQLQPENPRGHFNIAGVYLEQGKIEDALPYLRESARLGYLPAQQLLQQVQSQTRPPTNSSQSQSRWELMPLEQRCLLHALILLARFAYRAIGPNVFIESQQKETFFGLSKKNVLKDDSRWSTNIESLSEFDAKGFQGERNGATLEIHAHPSFLIRVTMPSDEAYEVGVWIEHKFKGVPQASFLKQKHHVWTIQQSDLEEKLNSLLKDEVIKISHGRLVYLP